VAVIATGIPLWNSEEFCSDRDAISVQRSSDGFQISRSSQRSLSRAMLARPAARRSTGPLSDHHDSAARRGNRLGRPTLFFEPRDRDHLQARVLLYILSIFARIPPSPPQRVSGSAKTGFTDEEETRTMPTCSPRPANGRVGRPSTYGRSGGAADLRTFIRQAREEARHDFIEIPA